MLHQELPKKDVMPVMVTGSSKQAVYLDFADAIKRYGKIEAGKQGIQCG